MATPLFRPGIADILIHFLEEMAEQMTKKQLDQFQEVTDLFNRYLDQEGSETLPSDQKKEWELASAKGQHFSQVFTMSHLLPNVPGFLQDLTFQQALLPPGTLPTAQDMMHRLGRWLLSRELAPEQDYRVAIQALPGFEAKLDRADELSSALFDVSREDPPLGRIFDEIRGYVEIVRVHRGVLTVVPLQGNAVHGVIHVDPSTSSLAEVGWWIDARLARTANGWQFVDVGSVLP